jgi:hypothetical protein
MKKDKILKIADKIVLSMAYNRREFKNKAQEHIGGALLEFYKAALAKKNIGIHPWIDHWMKEVDQLLSRNLTAAIVHPSKGFKDKQKALNEAFAELKTKDLSYRRIAENTIKRDYDMRDINKKLDDNDTDEFWKLVQDAVDLELA